jgi:hypothetical protein
MAIPDTAVDAGARAVVVRGGAGAVFGGVAVCGGAGLGVVVACDASSKLSSIAITIGEL